MNDRIILPRSAITSDLWRDEAYGRVLWYLISEADETGTATFRPCDLEIRFDLSRQRLRTILDRIVKNGIATKEQPTSNQRATKLVFDIQQDTLTLQPTSNQAPTNEQPNSNQLQPLIPMPESDSLTSFADIFNSKVEGTRIPSIRGLSDTRKRALKNLAKEYGAVALESILDKVVASDFLSGRKTDFCASFDWIYKKANFLKIYEGNYDNTIRPSGFVARQADRYSALEAAAETVLRNAPYGYPAQND